MLLFPLSGSYASMCSGPHQGLALEIQRSIFNQILGASLPHHETQMHTHLPWNILATKNEPESNQASIKRPLTDNETSKCSCEEANRQVQNVGHSLGPLIWVVQQIKGKEIRKRRTMRAALDERPLQSHNHQMAGGGLVWTLICTNNNKKTLWRQEREIRLLPGFIDWMRHPAYYQRGGLHFARWNNCIGDRRKYSVLRV